MKYSKNFVLLILMFFSISCEKNNISTIDLNRKYLAGTGVFILNEGNFMAGNGSVSFYSKDSLKIYNDLFSEINERPLGDVPNSMNIYGGKAYIIVNNSGKIEVVEKNTLKSTATITGLISPRFMKFISSTKAYVSTLYSDSVVIIDPSLNEVKGYINLRRSSEALEISGNKAFIANWSGGHELMVVNTLSNKVIDSINVAVEPESMVVDKNGKLWVLCTGGYLNKQFPELIRINTATDIIEQRFVFADRYSYPTNLTINGERDILFFLDNGVKKMNINDSRLPEYLFINQKRGYFYKMGIDPVSGEVFTTDAGDYQHKGKVLRYGSDGIVLDSVMADIIPSSLCFKSDSK